MGGRAQLGEPPGFARLEAQDGCAWRQGVGHVSSDAERIACRQLYGDHASQRQNHGRCRPAWHRGGVIPLMTARFSSALAAATFMAPFAVAAPANAAPAQWPDISGIYWTNSYSAKIQPVGGGDPPYKPEAMAAYRKNMELVKTFSLNDKARKVCTPDGVPRILQSPYPFEIVESPNRGEVHILYELNHVIRPVTMTKPLPSEEELETFPFYSGHSAGHWEGDTLVVETAGFNEMTFLDNLGAPHTDQLRTVEH